MARSFAKRVYRVVAKIPKGKTMSYQSVARAAGSPNAYRAVGNIMNKHNVPELPCHRVVKSDGSIGGYRYGTKKKQELLTKEGAIANLASQITSLENDIAEFQRKLDGISRMEQMDAAEAE